MALEANKPARIELIMKPYMVSKAINNSRRYDIFHPSAWGSCLRRIAYSWYNQHEKFFTKTEFDIDLRNERVFDNGHGTHARWQNYLDNAGVLRGAWKCINPLCGKVYGEHETLGIFNPQRTNKDWICSCGNNKKLEYVEAEVKSPLIYNFEGHVDAIIDVRGTPHENGNPDMNVYVCDFKTMKDSLFEKLEEAKHEHVVQVHIYMWLLDLKAAVVLYENKNDQALKEIFVPRNEAMIDDIKKKSEWMVGLLQHRKLPPRDAGMTLSAFPCRGCEFAKLCW